MRAGDQFPGFVPAVRSFLLAGERSLFSFQVPLRLSQMAGVVELGAVARDSEMGQADIDADRLPVRRDGGQASPSSVRMAAWNCPQALRLTVTVLIVPDDLAMHDALRPADFRQIDARSFDLHPLRVLDRLATMLGLEARIFAAFLEEVLERAREILQGCCNA